MRGRRSAPGGAAFFLLNRHLRLPKVKGMYVLYQYFQSSCVYTSALSVQSTGSSALHLCKRCNSSGGAAAAEHGEDLYVSHYAIPPDAHQLVGTPQLLPRNPAEEVAFKKNLMRSFPVANIRNVSVVAHVDHGKTTLSDAMLRFANLLPADGATGTFTDRLQVEKERGITIKAQTCSVLLTHRGSGAQYLINLIDTPGHVDFQYEVSRSLCASEGAALLVDVRQGVEAQTMAQFYAALEQNLTILPVLTKMDSVLNDAQVEKTLLQLEDSTGLLTREVVLTSAKSKTGIEQLFQQLIDKVPPPSGRVGFSDMKQLPVMHPDSAERKQAERDLVPLRALLFDCWTAESSGMSGSDGSAGVSNAASSGLSSTKPSSPVTSSFLSMATAAASGVAGSPAFGGHSLAMDGIYGLVRVVDGTVTPGTTVTFFHSSKKHEVREVGIIHPTLHPTAALTTGMVGYVFFPGLTKRDVLIGDTLCTLPTRRHTLKALTANEQCSSNKGSSRDDVTIEREDSTAATSQPSAAAIAAGSADSAAASTEAYAVQPIPGFKTVQPVVFAGFYPDEGDFISQLRDAVDLLCVNDPSVTVEPLQCPALGPGLQLGFLGLLHMQVFKERLLTEFGQAVLVTPPQVQYMYVEPNCDPQDKQLHKPLSVSNWLWPHEGAGAYLEPFVTATVLTPSDYFNEINSAALSAYRGEMEDMRVIDDARTLARYRMPLADLARGFFSTVKSTSHGYATLEYDAPTYAIADLVKMDVVINKARISALSTICLRQEANTQARRILSSLKENLQRSTVDLPLQALIGSKIIARETIKAYRKDVTAKIHAGDISRKQKKWNDQKKGKERMARRSVGTVTLDQNVLAAAMGATSSR
ncbi:putative mitochondrial GTP-binding protein [Leptomonas pyrrhocoris]|uniref:Translation factor GUF1 homolog, mitochondrial n=1 Tax=Leptomonas pyrrhocoris TaxID=157538 RepID=A0A0N0VFX6_LEPPY|nr:putative mitochondrial GTP-binding protein [Leptomonas pyrrhocoris]KPA82061.1 putative mitochondrial GTP-binding protein [Leptomonas pyrrhocoris]|eukprot:XP_015660500.1 putative mitochondrial GTP-binding protein [Leptomonas pyrrhocoris]